MVGKVSKDEMAGNASKIGWDRTRTLFYAYYTFPLLGKKKKKTTINRTRQVTSNRRKAQKKVE